MPRHANHAVIDTVPSLEYLLIGFGFIAFGGVIARFFLGALKQDGH